MGCPCELGVEHCICVCGIVSTILPAIWIIHKANQWLKVCWVSPLTPEEKWLCVIQESGGNTKVEVVQDTWEYKGKKSPLGVRFKWIFSYIIFFPYSGFILLQVALSRMWHWKYKLFSLCLWITCSILCLIISLIARQQSWFMKACIITAFANSLCLMSPSREMK